MSDQRQMHDYSGSRRGGGIGRKSITTTLKRRGGSRQIGKETRLVTIKRTAALAAFVFDAYNPPWDYKEIKPVKSEYAEGESVYVLYCVKNRGEVKGKWTITVKDLDTGVVLTTYYGDLDPGLRFKVIGAGAYVGKMPNRDWRLDFTITP